jgi:hypothetical protein
LRGQDFFEFDGKFGFRGQACLILMEMLVFGGVCGGPSRKFGFSGSGCVDPDGNVGFRCQAFFLRLMESWVFGVRLC